MRSSAKYIWIIIVILFVGGFLLAQTSGLLGRSPVTPTTAVATVNGDDILATTWSQLTQSLEQQATQQSGHAVTLDEADRYADQAYDQLVTDKLLEQEYRRRGITVTDEEITEAARYSPPSQLMQSPDFQTEGQFDPSKYQRFLGSAAAREEGLLVQLENYYRNEIPKQKLFDQVTSDVYVSDADLWLRWRDSHDSAQVSLAVFDPERIPDADVKISDDDIRAYYDAHRKDFNRPGRAVLSVVVLPRQVTAADSAAVRQHALDLRAKIVAGEKFEDVARSESSDSGSAANGGSLGKSTRGRYVPAFEEAAYTLKPGEISQPVLTQFGYHIIKLDARSGDTLTLRHILLPIQQTDSEATATDRAADSLAKLAASTDQPEKFDEAARALKLSVIKVTAIEGNPATFNGKIVPSVGPWAFKGVSPGETSELFDADEGYYLARLDSLAPGGDQSLDQVKDEIRVIVMKTKKLDLLMDQAGKFAKLAAAGSLEDAARLTKVGITHTGMFTRISRDPELQGLTEAAGAAFALPVGVVSAPIKSESAGVVERVDRRVPADTTAWEAQKTQERQSELEALRQQRITQFLDNLKQVAKITDRRKQIEAATRQSAQ